MRGSTTTRRSTATTCGTTERPRGSPWSDPRLLETPRPHRAGHLDGRDRPRRPRCADAPVVDGRRSARGPVRTGRRRAARVARAGPCASDRRRSFPATALPSSPDRHDAVSTAPAAADRLGHALALHWTVSRVPADGASLTAAVREVGVRAVRGLRARAVLHDAVRLLRLQHLHREELHGTYASSSTSTRPLAEIALARRVLGDAAARCRRCSSAAARRRCSPPATSAGCCAAIGDGVRAGAGRRGHHRGQPRLGDAAGTSRSCARPASTASRFGMQLRRRRTCWPPSTARTPPAGWPTAVGWARAAGFDQRQPRPDLRHAGGVAGRLAASLDAAICPASPTTSSRTR